MHQFNLFVRGSAIAALALSGAALGHNVIEVGANSAGALSAHHEMHYELGPSTITGVTGFAAMDPAFESVQLPDPMEDLLPIDAGASLRARVVSLENLVILEPETLEDFAVGNHVFLGKRVFNIDVIWQIASGGVGAEGHAVIVFEDLNGLHAASEPITFTFVAVPSPATAGLLGLAGLVACRRRR